MKANEASWDRIARVVLGIVLIGVGFLVVGGGWGWVIAAIGVIPLSLIHISEPTRPSP